METCDEPGTKEKYTIDEAKEIVGKRFGHDACFLYVVGEGEDKKRVIWGLEEVFELCGEHITRGLASDKAKKAANKVATADTLARLETCKIGADEVRALSSECFQVFMNAGAEFLKEWREAQQRKPAST